MLGAWIGAQGSSHADLQAVVLSRFLDQGDELFFLAQRTDSYFDFFHTIATSQVLVARTLARPLRSIVVELDQVIPYLESSTRSCLNKRGLEARSVRGTSGPFQPVSHFLFSHEEVAIFYAKETAMYQKRAPPESWGIHNTLSQQSLHWTNTKAAHPARCAALYSFLPFGRVRITI